MHVETYTGPQCFSDIGRKNWIPIPIFSAFSPSVNATRSQFPIRLAYALTVHKSQGETLSKGVIDFDKSERCLGSSYVQLTRFKNFNDFLLIPFAFDRITDKIKQCVNMIDRTNEEKRLKKLFLKTLIDYVHFLPENFIEQYYPFLKL